MFIQQLLHKKKKNKNCGSLRIPHTCCSPTPSPNPQTHIPPTPPLTLFQYLLISSLKQFAVPTLGVPCPLCANVAHGREANCIPNLKTNSKRCSWQCKVREEMCARMNYTHFQKCFLRFLISNESRCYFIAHKNKILHIHSHYNWLIAHTVHSNCFSWNYYILTVSVSFVL